MKSAIVVSLLALASAPSSARTASGPVERYALVAGANLGADRAPLQYAVADAERFARVLVKLGGVRPEDAILLKQPKLAELVEGLDRLRGRVVARGAGGGRSEVLVYYSGHADEKGLLLGEDRYSYRSLRDLMDAIPAMLVNSSFGLTIRATRESPERARFLGVNDRRYQLLHFIIAAGFAGLAGGLFRN